MSRLSLVVLANCGLVAAALGQVQRPIQWISNLDQGVARARNSALPLMFYIDASKYKDDDNELNKAQQNCFRDPLVRGIAEQRFVPVRLPQSSRTEQLLREMKAPTLPGYYVVFASPELKLVGTVGPWQVADPRLLAGQMTAAFRQYRADLFREKLKPRLEDKSAEPREVLNALKVIEEFLIGEADETVAELLKRDRLDKRVKKEVYDTLATLSTPGSVKALLEVAPWDKLAAKALTKCTPAGAEHMLPALDLEKKEQLVVAYEAAVAVCNIKGRRPRAFWNNKNQQLIADELERVKREVTRSARQWRDKYEAYR